ncbi:hypothetical protein SAMN02745729_101527 [Marinobacterium iners DSM 11526]|uniref:Uncharacterized protein n=1 Tax=Marinobacterium iners DSM 11526 TaxID=1122198 RepID=A0A1H3YLY6_9GAMM|nr:hypothetical protein SAMN02745729_101527 [Marinobacterium iners DSM 11526]
MIRQRCAFSPEFEQEAVSATGWCRDRIDNNGSRLLFCLDWRTPRRDLKRFTNSRNPDFGRFAYFHTLRSAFTARYASRPLLRCTSRLIVVLMEAVTSRI